MKTKRTSLTQHVRETARRLNEFRAEDLCNALDIRTYADAERIRNVIQALLKSGEFTRVTRGRYRYAGTGKEGWSRAIVTRIYRAMHIKGSFSARQIAALSHADESYVRTVIRRLKDRGDLENTGRVKPRTGRREMFFRICHSDNFYVEYVL